MKEEWLVKIEKTKLGAFRKHFDFHSMTASDNQPISFNNVQRNRVKSTSIKKKNTPLSNGHTVIEPGSPPPKEIEEILAPKLPPVKATPSASQSEIYVPSTKTLLQEDEMKKSMIGIHFYKVSRLHCAAIYAGHIF